MRKLSAAGLVLALMMALLTAAAADAPQACMNVVEQVAVPLALANDPKVGINNEYSAEELAEVVRAMADSGITLPENNTVTQMAVNGLGLYESVTIREFCDAAFGSGDDSWSLEELAWYGKIEVEIGSMETSVQRVPGKDNMTLQEAEAHARSLILDTYGKDMNLDDRSIWKPGREFTIGYDDDPRPRWSFWWTPKDLDHGEYTVEFFEGNPTEEAYLNAEIPDWTQPCTYQDLLMRFYNVYGWAMNKWPQSALRELHERMENAIRDTGDFYYAECEGYRLTEYPDPGENDISREEAIRIAKETLKRDRAALDSAVLTEYAGERTWLVRLVIYSADPRNPDEGGGSWIAVIDSRTGEVLSLEQGWSEEAFIPRKALQEAKAEIPENTTDYIAIAAEAVKAQYPGTDPLDETAYRAEDTGLYTHYVEFWPKSTQYGRITVTISQEGKVQDMNADIGVPDGDNLFDRYWYVYGYFANWGQERWMQLEKDMAEAEDPLSVDGQALKATHYPAESSVKIGKEEAKELAVLASGERTAEAHTCVLVDAKPHPVWILRVLTRGSSEKDPVYGIDAETGETVFTEWYEVDITPHYVLYSLPETWKKLEAGE